MVPLFVENNLDLQWGQNSPQRRPEEPAAHPGAFGEFWKVPNTSCPLWLLWAPGILPAIL